MHLYKKPIIEFSGIPENWCVKKLKFSIATTNGFAFSSDAYVDDGVALIRISDVLANGEIDVSNSKKLPTEYSEKFKEYVVQKSDILVAMTGATIGKSGIYSSEKKALLNQRVCKLVAKSLHQKFFWYVLNSNLYLQHIDITSFGGAQPNISDKELLDFYSLEPTYNEQQKIADFLDYKTAQIDALIAKKEALLLKLQEKRSALITQAVTKGINPNAPMKPSGVEWLGDVPTGWIKTKMKFVAEIILGLTYSPADIVSEGDGVLVLRSSNVQNGLIELEDNVYVNTPIPEKLRTKIDDILICSRNGSRALIGKCALIEKKVDGQTFGAFMTLLRSKHTKFIYYILNSNIFKFQSSRFLTSTINQLTTETLGGFEIALPPIDEQKLIVEYLEEKTKFIDKQISKVTDVINKLNEYRAALITNAVTGKIDVRDFDIPNKAQIWL